MPTPSELFEALKREQAGPDVRPDAAVPDPMRSDQLADPLEAYRALEAKKYEQNRQSRTPAPLEQVAEEIKQMAGVVDVAPKPTKAELFARALAQDLSEEEIGTLKLPDPGLPAMAKETLLPAKESVPLYLQSVEAFSAHVGGKEFLTTPTFDPATEIPRAVGAWAAEKMGMGPADPSLMLRAESQADWLMKVVSLPANLIMNALRVGTEPMTGGVFGTAEERGLPGRGLELGGVEVPGTASVRDWMFSTLDHTKRGNFIASDVWKYTEGELPDDVRQALWAITGAAEVLYPWEGPYMSLAGKAVRAADIARMVSATHKGTKAARIEEVVRSTLDAMMGMELDVATRGAKQFARALRSGEFKMSDVPLELLNDLDVVARASGEKSFAAVLERLHLDEPFALVDNVAGDLMKHGRVRVDTDAMLDAIAVDPRAASAELLGQQFDRAFYGILPEQWGVATKVTGKHAQRAIDLFEEGMARSIKRRLGSTRFKNIGGKRADQALFVTTDRAHKIQTALRKELGAIVTDADIVGDANVVDGIRIKPEAANKYRAWAVDKGVEFTEEQSARFGQDMTLDEYSDMLFEVKKSMAGVSAQARLVTHRAAAGHTSMLASLSKVARPVGWMAEAVSKYSWGAVKFAVPNSHPSGKAVAKISRKLRGSAAYVLDRFKEGQMLGLDMPNMVHHVIGSDMGGALRYRLADPFQVSFLFGRREALAAAKGKAKAALKIQWADELLQAWNARQIYLPTSILKKFRHKDPAERLVGYDMWHKGVQSNVDQGLKYVMAGLWHNRDEVEFVPNALQAAKEAPGDLRLAAWREFFEGGRLGPAWDRLQQAAGLPKPVGGLREAAFSYLTRMRGEVLMAEALEVLKGTGLALSDTTVNRRIVDVAGAILRNEDIVASSAVRAEAYRWLEVNGLYATGISKGVIGKDAPYRGVHITRELARDLAAANLGAKRVVSLFATSESWTPTRWLDKAFTAHTLSILGGAVLPNVYYHVVNLMDTAFLLHRNLGLAKTVSVFGKMFTKAPQTKYIATHLSSYTDILDDLKLAKFAVPRFATPDPARLSEAVVRGPGGEMYSVQDLARAAREGGLETSRVTGQVGRRVIDDLKENDRGFFLNLTRGYLKSWPRLLNEFSHGVEVYARSAIMVDAIENGHAVDAAIDIARDALLDYGHLSDFERRFMRFMFKFYAFEKANMVSFLTALKNNPGRVGAQLRLNRASWEANGVDTKDRRNWTFSQSSRLALGTLTNNGQVFRTDGKINPQLKGYLVTAPGLSLPQAMFRLYSLAALVGGSAGEKTQFETAQRDIGRSVSPLLSTVWAVTHQETAGRDLMLSPMVVAALGEDTVAWLFQAEARHWNEETQKPYGHDWYTHDEFSSTSAPKVWIVKEGPAASAFLVLMSALGAEIGRLGDWTQAFGLLKDQREHTAWDRLPQGTGVGGMLGAENVRGLEKMGTGIGTVELQTETFGRAVAGADLAEDLKNRAIQTKLPHGAP